MTHRIGYTPAPRKIRVTVFVDRHGTTTSRYTGDYSKNAWILEVHNLKTRGFIPLASYNIPVRCFYDARLDVSGFNRFYVYFVRYAIRFLGI